MLLSFNAEPRIYCRASYASDEAKNFATVSFSSSFPTVFKRYPTGFNARTFMTLSLSPFPVRNITGIEAVEALDLIIPNTCGPSVIGIS